MERNIKSVGNSRLKKEELLNLVYFYENQLDILDLMLNDMNNVNIGAVQIWLDDTINSAPKFTKSINSFDEKNYTQLDLRNFC